MTDNNQQPPEDFSHQDHQEMVDESQAPAGFGANLASAWRTKPLFKLIVIMIVLAAIVAVISNLLGGGKDANVSSSVVAPPSMGAQAPGGKETPFRMKELNEANKTGEQQALAKGGSFIPTPHGEESNVDDAKDPLKELQAQIDHMKQMVEDQKRQQVQQQALPKPQPQQQQQEKFDSSLASAMQSQMQKLMADWKPKGMHVVNGKANEAPGGAGSTTASAASANANASNLLTQSPEFKTVVSAGTVNYGQLLTEANSDVPGPILAQIVSGPLAGARAVGQFKVINDYLVLHFEIANLKNKDYSIDALALDPDTTLGGMATEVDERYFTRLVLPAAAAFMQGVGQELASGNSTITSSGTTTIVTQGSEGFRQGMYNGFGSAATTAGQFFRDQANKTQPLVRVAAGTPIGFFFIRTVTDESQEQIAAAAAAAAGVNGQILPGALNGLSNPAVTNFGGQPISQQGAQAGPYGNGPLGTASSGGYGGYGGGYGGGYPGVGVPGAMPVGVGAPGYYGR